jgi:leader peptidase (prepilin peptidase)/N-methyltransferase
VGVLVYAHLAFVAAAVPLALHDLRTHRLPDRYTLGLWALSAVAVLSHLVPAANPTRVETAMGAMAIVVVLLWILAESPGQPLGFGDVKLGGVLGLQLGWYGLEEALGVLVWGFVMGGAVALFLVATGRMRVDQHIAFGPFLIAGGLIQLSSGMVV